MKIGGFWAKSAKSRTGDFKMKAGIQVKGFALGLGLMGMAAYSAVGGTIFQTGTSGTTYTDALGDQQGSANLLRDISSVTISNDATDFYITLNISTNGNLATGGAFNYVIGITTGSPTAGGDTSAAADHGNPYGRAISFDSSFGGMTDWIGIFGAGGSGSVASPYTSYGFNDYAYGTPGSVGITNGVWTKMNTVTNGSPMSMQPGTTNLNSVTITVPKADFASNLTLTAGSVIDFDLDSTGTSGNQTAYDSLAVQGAIFGTFNATNQFNETVLDQYTVGVPEPSTMALVGLGSVSLMLFRRRRK
jgi:hypothetical protein